MIKQLFIFIAIAGMFWLLFPLLQEFVVPEKLNELSADYITGSALDLQIPNTVTAIVVTYRGLDTLGEVTVLFLATAGVGFLLKKKGKKNISRRQGSEILQTGAGFLAPLILLLGVYVFSHGHLSPGGGFQGGVLIASAFLLLALAKVDFRFSKNLIHFTESLSGSVYVLLAAIGIFIVGANHFLDPRFLPSGTWFTLFSAGAVPLIYSVLGLKVGSELSSVINSLQNSGGEE
jgi:multicomponent Na+:H+ antiporter subunit B